MAMKTGILLGNFKKKVFLDLKKMKTNAEKKQKTV